MSYAVLNSEGYSSIEFHLVCHNMGDSINFLLAVV